MQDLLSQLEATFKPRHVPITEFAESHEFAGRKLYPRQKLLLKLFFLEDLTDEEEAILDYWEAGGAGGTEITISPFMRERIKYLKDNGYKHFREIVLVGGRRSSKGFVTGLSLAYKVFQLVQLQDPAQYYGIDSEKPILFSCVAAAQQQAKEMQYSDFAGMVNSVKYFNKNRHVGKMQELEFSVLTESDKRKLAAWKRQGRTVLKDTSTIRGNALPANARTIRGSATMALVFDEFAHFMQGESDQSDSEVYAAATPALAQFGRDGMIFCNSSPFAKTGKFFQRFEEAMATDNGKPASNPIFTLRLPSWALYEGWWESPLYRGPKKCITVSPEWDPLRKNPDGTNFYTVDDQQGIFIARDEEASDPIKYKVERRGHWAEVVDAYLNPASVDRMYQGRIHTDGVHYEPLKLNYTESTYEYRYRAHLDPSSTTAGFGFALAHVEEITVQGRTEQHVIFDIIKRWNPEDYQDGVIDWDAVIREVLYIADIFRPHEITMDQHNSKYPIQTMQRELRARGINEVHIHEKTANIQVNWNRAEVFRTALYRNLVHAPSKDTHPDVHLSSEELKYLQEIRSSRVPRIEKQDSGPVTTKDMADCVMEVVEALIGNVIANEVRSDMAGGLRVGSPGGYGIGFNERVPYRPLTDQSGNAFYGARNGEQAFPGSKRSKGRTSPTRRPIGGAPVQRKLPGW